MDWSFGVKFDFRVIGMLFFLWALVGFVSAFIDQNPVNFLKACVTLIVAWAFYFPGNKVFLQHYTPKEGETL
jgi:hypothetical protein